MNRRFRGSSILALVLAAAATLSVAPARAEDDAAPLPAPEPDPRFRKPRFSRGFFTEGHVGAMVFLGDTGKVTKPGPAFGLRAGYDLFSWFALYMQAQGSIHEATPPPPPVGQHFQNYVINSGARLQLSIGRFGIFASGLAGLMFFSSNVLDRTGITSPKLRSSFAVGGGGGFDWHTWNRHFSMGLEGSYALAPSLQNTSALTTTVYLRYAH